MVQYPDRRIYAFTRTEMNKANTDEIMEIQFWKINIINKLLNNYYDLQLDRRFLEVNKLN